MLLLNMVKGKFVKLMKHLTNVQVIRTMAKHLLSASLILQHHLTYYSVFQH